MPEQKITLNRKFHLNERDPTMSEQPPNLRERIEKPSEPFLRATNSETSGLELHDLTIHEAEVAAVANTKIGGKVNPADMCTTYLTM